MQNIDRTNSLTRLLTAFLVTRFCEMIKRLSFGWRLEKGLELRLFLRLSRRCRPLSFLLGFISLQLFEFL